MKSLFKFIFIFIIVVSALAFVFYQSSLYTKYVNEHFAAEVLPEWKNLLENSYLYDNSNLDRLSYKFNRSINVKLKRRATYNPQDTKKLFYDFVDKYTASTDTLSIMLLPLKTYDIKFYLADAEDYGPAFIYKNGKIINNYSDLREQIIRKDNERAAEKKAEKEQEQKQARNKELAQKAFGFINFGDTVEEANLKFEEDPRIKTEELMINNPIYTVNLGGYKYNLKPVYRDEKLHLINLVSDAYLPAQYKTELKKNWEDIIDFYNQLHGHTDSKFIAKDEIEEEFIEWTAEWNIAKKSIKVGLSKNNDRYHVVIWISHKDFPVDKF